MLSDVLVKIRETQQDRPDLVLAAWPEVIGPQLSTMTQAVSFSEGVLLVKVKNSTLHSLLSQHDKGKIIAGLKARFPRLQIENILFRIG
ncbi:MAG: DUF721 domain-containing protein [Parachlamydiaceae bacterium]|nr:MAG: DUF721 domain-containing protein [Parachlamydiaceae bacterium]